MMNSWEPPADVKPWMVCAACRKDWRIVLGARHWDRTMNTHNTAFEEFMDPAEFDQGFIDQWGRFYTREEAMAAVKANGQPFNIERNGGQDRELFSEGLY